MTNDNKGLDFSKTAAEWIKSLESKQLVAERIQDEQDADALLTLIRNQDLLHVTYEEDPETGDKVPVIDCFDKVHLLNVIEAFVLEQRQ